MEYNHRIVKSAIAAAQGFIPGLETRSGFCLKVVRQIIEHALYGGRYEFYDDYLIAGTTFRAGNSIERVQAARLDPWASDLEASMKQHQPSLSIPATERQAGDLVFDHTVANGVGHVGILISPDWVIENINPVHRPYGIRTPVKNLVISPYQFPYEQARWTLVARLRPL